MDCPAPVLAGRVRYSVPYGSPIFYFLFLFQEVILNQFCEVRK
ncbi:hypothetical protein ART_1222 [Arthrobacter sp. PAMC 25486]|nr:hypothetical protein ART_1222 [Arthrobacter sp. PAMC 25486]